MIYTHTVGRAAHYYPARTALASGDVARTFRELHARVGARAAFLRQHGFATGDRLALLLPNEAEYLELIYACAWLGVIAVPLNTRLATPEIDRVLADASPSGLIRHSSLVAPSVPPPWQRVLDVAPLELPDTPPPDPLYDPEATLALIYTSGTTGTPKGVALTHAALLADIDHLCYWISQWNDGVYLHASPLFHIADLPLAFAAPAFGVSQVTIPKFGPEEFCQVVQRERVTTTVLVPTMINVLTQFAGLRDYDLSSLDTVGYGGSPMAPELVQRTRELLPRVKLMQVYGLSETGFVTALRDDEHTLERLLSCGRPCPGVDLRIADERGNEVPSGQIGELVVRGANVMRGYSNNDAETALSFRNGYFRTGDVGYQSAEGYFYILDRLKDMIVTGGENVYSGEVEAVIYKHPAVREAAVFGIPDPKWGELVMASVVTKTGQSLTADELTAHCRRSLAGYKVPRRIEVTSVELPKSGSGKILKRALRKRFWASQSREVS